MSKSKHEVEKRPYCAGLAVSLADLLVERLTGEVPASARCSFIYVGEQISGVQVAVNSPVGDSGRDLLVWTQDDEVGVGFGDWHGHFELEGADDVEVVLRFVSSVVADLVVLTVSDDDEEIVDLRDDSLEELMTAPGAPEIVELKSWGGTSDRSAAIGVSL